LTMGVTWNELEAYALMKAKESHWKGLQLKLLEEAVEEAGYKVIWATPTTPRLTMESRSDAVGTQSDS